MQHTLPLRLEHENYKHSIMICCSNGRQMPPQRSESDGAVVRCSARAAGRLSHAPSLRGAAGCNPANSPGGHRHNAVILSIHFFYLFEDRNRTPNTPIRGLILSIHFFYLLSIPRLKKSCYTFCATHPDTQVAEGVMPCQFARLCTLS